MPKTLFLICVLGTACTSWAQSHPTSWENLNGLQPGEKIQVLEMSSKKVSGTFLNASEEEISVQGRAGSQAIQRDDVRSVKLVKNRHRFRNTLIGAGVGAGVGAAIGSTVNTSFISRGAFVAGAAGVFMVPGAVAGALVPNKETIYLVGSH
jgi:outer membrane lipoprotein SlyB